MIERLKELYKHNCMNCKYLEMYHDGCPGGKLHIDYDCAKNVDFYMPQYFWRPFEINDCKLFETNPKIGSNQKYIKKWRKDCYKR